MDAYGGRHPGSSFAGLESHSHGGDGERKWVTVEGQQSITAKIDRLGHICCDLTSRDNFGPTGWAGTLAKLVESGEQSSASTRALADLFGRPLC